MMNMRLSPFVLLALLVYSLTWSPASGQDEIIVRGSSRIDVAIANLGGPAGAGVARDLGNLLRDSGYITLKAPGPGVYVVTGGSDGRTVDGILTGPQGQSLFRQRYQDTRMQSNVARLADDIIEAVVGVPGINASQIVFVGRLGGRKELFRCAPDGSGLVQLTRDRSISVSPSISPNGEWVAYTSYASGYPDIYTIGIEGQGRRRIVNAPGTNGGAAISPDGNRIACTMSFSGNKELYIVGRGGGRGRPLTRTRASESSPTWSPNGSEIIYCSDQSGRPQLYRISASGGQGRLLPLGQAYCTEPSWSPDGQRLAFTARSGGMSVMLHDFRSGRTQRLRSGEDPSWAPDSRHVAYAANGSLYILNVDSGSSRRVPVNVAGISEPTWSR